MSERFLKSSRLLRRREFENVSRKGKRRTGQWIAIDIMPRTQSTITRLGITVTKKFGKAHDRNRFKRLVREAFRKMSNDLPPSLDINVRPRSLASKSATLQDIQADLLRLIKWD